ncbi:unnamed protein product [Cylindrotheca closterium]|uniref:FAS1 domain-containing protein n=1 Tax=Cylindrotheca closterium TaxID=2856 RepID=A0AAD2FFQ2_9STRA|nr:unnamed protein product [Cylindrotheca closterium]
MKYTAAILAAVFSVANAQFQPIADAGEYSALLDAVVATGSGSTLVSAAPVTIFGPKDSAFEAIQDIVDRLNEEQLTAVLLDHVVVGGAVDSATVVAEGCIEAETAGGLMLGIKYDADTNSVTVNGIAVTAFDITGDYGVLHGIESVLVPGLQGDFVPCPPPAIVAPIANNGNYGILLEALLGIEDLLPTIEGAAPVTIFGPKDSAFRAIRSSVENLSEEETTALLLNHVIVGAAVNSSQVAEKGCIEAETAGGLMLGILFNPDDSTVTINGIPVTDFDIAGDYGILHGIESVLIPGDQGDFIPCPAFAADFTPIAEKGIYSTLLGAVVSTGNDAVISQNVPVTIFGPNDDAFAAIQDTVDGLSTEALSGVLLNHVVVGAAVESSAVVKAGCLEAVAAGGMNLAIRYNATTQVADVNGIVINDFDVTGNYGVLHGIASVITSSDGYVACPILSVVEQVAATGNYNTLLGFLDNPMLQGQLENVGPITIFGPNDAAFAAVSSDLDGIDQATLIQTLGGHVVAGVYTAADVKAEGCVLLDTIVGTKVRAMFVESDDGCRRKLAGHEMPTDPCCRRRLAGHEMPADDGCRRNLAGHEMVDDSSMGHVMINDAMVILADIEDGTSIFHGLDKVLLGGTFECPTDVPVAGPTTAPAPAGDVGTMDEGSSAAFSGISAFLAAVVALSAFVV